MRLEDPEWETWSQQPYPPIAEPDWPQSYGCSEEPQSSLWCASLAHGFGEKWREGVAVLDYGCGGARFANFLSRRLQDFRYVGVEPESGAPIDESCATKAGPTNLQLCETTFGHDPRVRFGAIGSEVELDALAHVDVIVAGSVFTHLPFRFFEQVMDKFRGTIARGADLVFSVFLGDAYSQNGGPGLYGVENCWTWVVYTRAMLDELAERLDVKVEETGTFQGGYFEHHIMRASACVGTADG